MEQLKKLGKGIAIFIPFVVFIVGVNFFVDPANLYNDTYEQTVAEILASGHGAANLQNMDDRAMQLAYVDLLEDDLSTLVLGPSRGMQLSRTVTGDDGLYNAGMTGADLRDVISIYFAYEERGKAPQQIVLVVEPWMTGVGSLNPNAYTEGYEAFAESLGTQVYASEKRASAKYEQLVSLTYFQSSLAFLMAGQRKELPYATDEHYTETDMRRADGSYCYQEPFREASLEQREEEASNCVLVTPEIIAKFGQSDKALETQFEAFVAYLQEQGKEVAIMLPPLNPILYDHMCAYEEKFGAILQTQSFYEGIAQAYHVPIFGSFNPHDLGLTTNDFYDGLHCTDTAAATFYPNDLWVGVAQ